MNGTMPKVIYSEAEFCTHVSMGLWLGAMEKPGQGGHSDLNDQYSFHSTIDTSQGVQGVSKNPDDQTEVYSGQLER